MFTGRTIVNISFSQRRNLKLGGLGNKAKSTEFHLLDQENYKITILLFPKEAIPSLLKENWISSSKEGELYYFSYWRARRDEIQEGLRSA